MVIHGAEAVLGRSAARAPRRLDAAFREAMEERLGEDLAAVRIGALPAARARHAPLAMTIADRILVSPVLDRMPAEVARAVIAHELVHIVQKRRGRGGPRGATGPRHGAAIEAEAELGALRLCVGAPFRPLLADAPQIPRFWGPAGHYYTCYFVMLAAGVDPEMARLRSVFCQLPDQVRQFDATAAAIDSKVDADSIALRGAVRASGLGPANPHQWYESVQEKSARILQNAQVESGLHSLTGSSSSDEQSFRFKVLTEIFNSRDHLAVGLGLHAFGDSFAHVDQSNRSLMYKNGIGHGAELFSAEARDRILDALVKGGSAADLKEALSQNLLHAHDPDDVTNRRPGRSLLYLTYVACLHVIAQKASGRARLPLQPTVRLLSVLTQMWTPQGQEQNDIRVIHYLRRFSIEVLGIPLADYAPETEEADYFAAYYVRHKPDFSLAGYSGKLGQQMANDRIRTLAARWARHFTVQSFSP